MRTLDSIFGERQETFWGLFDCLDDALSAGDPSQAASVLESITALAKTSPFKDLIDLETPSPTSGDVDEITP